MLPTGSAAQGLSDGVAEAADVGNAHQAAKMKGMVGEVGTFTVNNGATKDWTSNLTPPSQGERGKDPLAALFVCSAGGQNYAWAGYEEVEDAPDATDAGSLSGLSGLSSGSTGSNDVENPATDPDATDPDATDPDAADPGTP